MLMPGTFLCLRIVGNRVVASFHKSIRLNFRYHHKHHCMRDETVQVIVFLSSVNANSSSSVQRDLHWVKFFSICYLMLNSYRYRSKLTVLSTYFILQGINLSEISRYWI